MPRQRSKIPGTIKPIRGDHREAEQVKLRSEAWASFAVVALILGFLFFVYKMTALFVG